MKVPGDERAIPLNEPGFRVNAVRVFVAALALGIRELQSKPGLSAEDGIQLLNLVEENIERAAGSGMELEETELQDLEVIRNWLEAALNQPAAKFLGPPEGPAQ